MDNFTSLIKKKVQFCEENFVDDLLYFSHKHDIISLFQLQRTRYISDKYFSKWNNQGITIFTKEFLIKLN